MLLLLGLLGGALPVAGAQRALAAADTPEYGVRAALAGKTTIEKNHFAYALPAGGVVLDAAIISNFTDRPLTFAVHGADLVTAQGGGAAPQPEGTVSTAVGTWILVGQPTVTVPPHGEIPDFFVVKVPPGSQAGDYLGALVVAEQTSAPAGFLQVATRAALIARVTVPGAVHLGVSPGPLKPDQQGDDVTFELPVRNTGNVLFSFTGDVTVSDSKGKIATIQTTPQDLYVIPGGTATVKATWHGVPRFGSVAATGAIHATLNGQPAGTFTTSEVHLNFFPWLLLLLLGLVLAGLIAAVVLTAILIRRRRRGACAHCAEQMRRGALVEVTDEAEVSACSHCLSTVRRRSPARLCRRCLTQHLMAGTPVARAS